jgi:hypothetical protein
VSLTLIGGGNYQAPYAGVSITEDLAAFVAMRQWDGKDLYVLDCKLFAAATGRWLKRCPYASEFKKHFTIYEDDLDFETALRDFCRAHGVQRLGYSEQDVQVSAGAVEPVAVDAEQLARAYDTLKQISPLKDKRDAKAVLAYFLDAQEQTAPVLAVCYAIASVDKTPREIAAAAEQNQQRAAAIEAEVAACEELPGDEVGIDVGGREGTRWVTKKAAIYLIRNFGKHLAKVHANAR